MRLFCGSAEPALLERWRGLFDLVDAAQRPDPAADELHLRFMEERLSLHRGADPIGVRLEPQDLRRRLSGELALTRACGGARQLLLDATAGLGVDALALRAKGYRVMLVERHPVLWAMLDNYLHVHGPGDVTLLRMDACELVERPGTLPERPDVVYLDPMFARSRKTALPGKRMQYLRLLLGDAPDDSRALLAMGLSLARGRVVLKRRLKDPTLEPPDWQIRARAVRYDVYDAARARAD